MAVSAGINPIRSVSASASDTNSKFCKYHHSCSTNTGGGNVPSDTSRVMATIFLSNQDGLEKDRMRRSILHINYMCVLGCQTHTASSGLSFRGILASVVSISFSAPWLSCVPWPYSFSRSKILGKDVADGYIFIMASTSSNMYGLRWLIPPPIGLDCCYVLNGGWIYLPVLGTGSGGSHSLGDGSVGVLPWLVCSSWNASVFP